MENLWNSLKERLRSKLAESTYKVWICPLTYSGVEGDTILLGCPNQFFASWVQEHYLPLIKEHLVQGDKTWKIKLCPVEKVRDAAKGQLHLPRFAPNELPRPRFCDRYTFDEFVVGSSNQYAYSACLSTANGDPNHSKVIYLHAGSGLGKSHLTQAAGRLILDRRPQARLCYVTANEFTHQVVRAVRNNEIDDFKKRYSRTCDALLLEEVQSVSGRDRTQTELALALDVLMDQGKTVILTGNRLPREIPKVNDILRSRLGSGLITTINPPDFDTRKRILRRKAKAQGVLLDESIVEFLASRLTGDIRQIEGAVIGLIAKSSLLKRPLDMDLAREVVLDLVGEPPEVTVALIKDMICRHFKLTEQEIISKSRKRAITWPRQIAMYLARRFTDSSLEAIGREFNRDHATVTHSIKRIRKELNTPGKSRHQIEFFMDQVEKKRWQS